MIGKNNNLARTKLPFSNRETNMQPTCVVIKKKKLFRHNTPKPFPNNAQPLAPPPPHNWILSVHPPKAFKNSPSRDRYSNWSQIFVGRTQRDLLFTPCAAVYFPFAHLCAPLAPVPTDASTTTSGANAAVPIAHNTRPLSRAQ